MKNARLAAVLVSGGLCTATSALAQVPAPSEATNPAAVTPPAKAEPAAADETLFHFYGMLNPRFIASTGAVESYSQPNAVAMTAAGNPVFSVAPDKARYSFQVAQSRLGFWVNEQGPLRARLEFDFVDFSKAAPTVASLPRVRLAYVDYSFQPGHTLTMGQDWDLHAPVNPHGINLVGALFQAGNTAFMRQQLKYVYSSPELELAAAVGFPTPNNAAKAGALEIGTLPTLALRGAYKFGKSRVGASVIGTRLPFNLGAQDERVATAVSAVLFSELSPSASTNVRLELNYGQDAANLGLLTLGQGNLAKDSQEVGGFLSVRQVLVDKHAVYGMVGYQQALDPNTVLPSYRYPAPVAGGVAPDFSTSALAGTGPGLLSNGTVRVGYELKPTSKLAFMVEGFVFRSHFQLQAVDVERVDPVRTSAGVELGALYSF